jgi:phosphoribosylanthranilate isomerase
MATVRVKVCGITSVEDAMVCVEAGVDALGFIFVEGTPRYIAPELAAPIIQRLPPFVTAVGVFWDHPRGHVKAAVERCGLGALQFHGDEAPEDLSGYGVPVIKTIKLPPAATIDGLPEDRIAEQVEALRYRGAVSAILLDSAARWSEGEAREPIEWTLARGLATGWACLVLSGGLTPDNVRRAVEVVRPYAVDVNSGVEASPRRKDPEKIRRFVAEARRPR